MSGVDPPKAPLPPLSVIPADLQTLADYERRARAHLSAEVFAHLEGGAGDGRTLIANRRQFDDHQLVPRILRDLRGGTTEITLFGQQYASPIMVAPLAYQKLAHPHGEIATVQAATAMDTPMIVSTLSSFTLEEIAASAAEAAQLLGRPAPPPLWFQLYLQPERDTTLQLIRRAEAAGYQVLVVTVDAGIKRSEFPLPHGVDAANLRGTPNARHHASALTGEYLFRTPLVENAPTWADIAWLRAQTKLPLVIKGLLNPDDARQAISIGADGVIVSNHGGRVIDNLIPPMKALPAIVDAVGGQIPVLLDSGVRRGRDILQALALGATATLIGRPILHGLAVAGVTGAAHILQILRVELELAMAQTGCRTPGDINAALLISA